MAATYTRHTHTYKHTHTPDNNGCPIMITLTGLIDPAKLVKAVTLDEIRLYIIYEMEHKLIELSRLTVKTGVLYRALEIHDLNGLGVCVCVCVCVRVWCPCVHVHVHVCVHVCMCVCVLHICIPGMFI